MKIDLHIHTSTGSDGMFTVAEVIREAKRRNIDLMSITDHDATGHQGQAEVLAVKEGIRYITGVELNVTFSYEGKSVSLDFLGYGFDYMDPELWDKLVLIRRHRQSRGRKILDKLNAEFRKEKLPLFTDADQRKMQEDIDGILGRPHIADYLTKKGVVGSRQEAFDKYLVKCNVPKYPLSLAEASKLIKNAGGILIHAHPNDPHGTSLVNITRDLREQTKIIEKYMLKYIDGVECWHSRHDEETTVHYIEFARKHDMLMTGGSDCHQKPLLVGTLDIPNWVAEQFN